MVLSMILGYARVSTGEQSLDGQRDALEKAGAGRLYAVTSIAL
jgi:DNA invertase Pin-like site-specific DNA recombinase